MPENLDSSEQIRFKVVVDRFSSAIERLNRSVEIIESFLDALDQVTASIQRAGLNDPKTRP